MKAQVWPMFPASDNKTCARMSIGLALECNLDEITNELNESTKPLNLTIVTFVNNNYIITKRLWDYQV